MVLYDTFEKLDLGAAVYHSHDDGGLLHRQCDSCVLCCWVHAFFVLWL